MRKVREAEPGFGSGWAELGREHFDGHTEFHLWSAEQRLRWLSELAVFIHSAREWREEREGRSSVQA